VFVVGHYPIWSVAENGPTPALISELKPLLEQFDVAAYFSGHDHDIQLLSEGNGVDFYVSGAGHVVDTTLAHAKFVPVGSSKFAWPTTSKKHGGYVLLQIQDRNTTTATYYDDQSTVLFQYNTYNPRASLYSTSQKKSD